MLRLRSAWGVALGISRLIPRNLDVSSWLREVCVQAHEAPESPCWLAVGTLPIWRCFGRREGFVRLNWREGRLQLKDASGNVV